MGMKHFLFSLIIAVVIVFGLSQSVLGRPLGDADELRKVTGEIRLLNLINGLELDKEQMEFIIQKAEEAKQLRADFSEKVSNDNPEVAKTLQPLQELRDTLLKGDNISGNLKAQVHKANQQMKEIQLEYHDKISQLAFEIKEILQPHQLYALENYVPCLIPPKQGAAGQANSSEAALKQLTRLREMPAPVFEERKDKIAQRIIEQIRRHLPRGYVIDEGAEKEWIISLLEEARSLSEADFAFKKTELVEKLKSRHALPKLPIDVSVKIERFLLNPEIIPLLNSKLAAGTGL